LVLVCVNSLHIAVVILLTLVCAFMDEIHFSHPQNHYPLNLLAPWQLWKMHYIYIYISSICFKSKLNMCFLTPKTIINSQNRHYNINMMYVAPIWKYLT
jgi:hypothetical protein